ncbi:hypothetical protein BV20DRAFT_1045787 [Pilatotrama ljubarskyi]|nr:hypothetical protein BV20DRAFT_1045787 [Pilatotrama ljubarskyi]
MLYAHLRYMVRFGGDTTECFQALMGILIGDPASPMLWILFLSDFALPHHPDDLLLSGRVVSHLELADDMALICLSAPGMQNKLDYFGHYCATSFLLVNVPKSLACVHGPLPSPLPLLLLYGEPLQYFASATYVGMTFTSTERDIFLHHYAKKHAAAQRAANATLSLESYIGPLPPDIALTLYRTHVDPHLIAGCEVALDCRPGALSALQNVQHTYLRRSLRTSSRAQLPPLFTETGIWPLQYRRYDLALRFLTYILSDECPPLLQAAFAEQWHLTAHVRASTWWGDLVLVGATLPVPVTIAVDHFPSLTTVRTVRAQLQASLAMHLHVTTLQSRRLPILQHHLCARRRYLALPHRRQREALTALLFSEHPLAVEQLRRAPTPHPIPRQWRVCRFCRAADAVEDEYHVLLDQAELDSLRDRP